MPIQYKESIMDSSIHCRKAAALFDVAHMCGASFRVRQPYKTPTSQCLLKFRCTPQQNVKPLIAKSGGC